MYFVMKDHMYSNTAKKSGGNNIKKQQTEK